MAAEPSLATELAAVNRHYRGPVYWDHAGVTHRCGGSLLHPGVFLLWPICGKGDVPGGEGYTAGSSTIGVTCPACLTALGDLPVVKL